MQTGPGIFHVNVPTMGLALHLSPVAFFPSRGLAAGPDLEAPSSGLVNVFQRHQCRALTARLPGLDNGDAIRGTGRSQLALVDALPTSCQPGAVDSCSAPAAQPTQLQTNFGRAENRSI